MSHLSNPISRRLFVKGIGGALALPLLQLPRSAQAVQATYPTRLILFYTPNGTKKELWRPAQSNRLLTSLGPILTPLQGNMAHISLLDKVTLKSAQEGVGDPHQRGITGLFTGSVIAPGDFVGGDGTRAGWASSISVDQELAKTVGQNTPFSSLELGVRVMENIPRSRMIYAGEQQPLPPENNPLLVYQRLFANLPTDQTQVQKQLARRKSVLDSVAKDFQQLQNRVTVEDKNKLDLHATHIRELEKRLSLISAQANMGNKPNAPMIEGDILAESNYEMIAKAQIDLLVSALATDQTRIGSLQCSSAVNALRFPFLNIGDEGHALSHAGDSSIDQQDEWTRVLTWYAGLFNYLLEALKRIPEGDGTLLDHSIVVWGNELGRGNNHSHEDVPLVVAGHGNGKLKMGQYLDLSGRAHNDLLISLLHCFDREDATFGDARFCTGQIRELFI